VNWYSASDAPELATFGTVRVLAVNGRGAPGGPEYGQCVRALYAVAGVLTGLSGGFPMPCLEGRWWVEEPGPALEVPRERWHWQLLLRLPDTLDAALADRAREGARGTAIGVDRIQLVTFTEGECVQIMHRGPYADEPASLARMDEFMRAKGLVPAGLHHEIYLSDVAESDPSVMRTVLRQPVRAAA
jgi:hypothetical protein